VQEYDALREKLNVAIRDGYEKAESRATGRRWL